MTADPARSEWPSRVVLLGHPVAHSRSPAFQNAALRAARIPLRYDALDVSPENLAATLDQIRLERWAGNVTIPHKRAVAKACDQLSEVAQQTGAVNTFWMDSGKLHGDNTDVAGFEAAITELGTSRVGAGVLCLGAGGAAAAVVGAVSQWPAAWVQIKSRSPDRAQGLIHRFPDTATLWSDDRGDEITLVVNATPLGLEVGVTPMDVSSIPRDADVMDLVYRSGETDWVRMARAAGHRALDGRVMLLNQGAQSFERWFSRAPDMNVMRAALEAAG